MDLSKIPLPLLLAVTMAACLGAAILKNYFNKKVSDTNRACQLFNIGSSISCAIFIIAYSGFRLEGSVYTLLIGSAFGIVTALSAIFNFLALSVGPLSYTTVMMTSSTVITALSGLFLGERISVFKWFGIALMAVCVILATPKSKDDANKKASVKWLIYSAIAALFSAGVGLIQKIHQKSEHSGELTLMLFVAFIFSTLFSVVLYFIYRRKDAPVFSASLSKETKKKLIMLILAVLIVAGISIALNNIINLYLVGVLDSAIFFPIVNGGHLILTTLAGLVLFREKLTSRQWIGILSGIAAGFLLCF